MRNVGGISIVACELARAGAPQADEGKTSPKIATPCHALTFDRFHKPGASKHPKGISLARYIF